MNINDDNAQRLIILAALITLGSTTYAIFNPPPGKTAPKPHRAIVGGVFAFAISSVIAEFDAKLGVLLAGLVTAGAFFSYGLPSITQTLGSKREKEEQLKELKKGQR